MIHECEVLHCENKAEYIDKERYYVCGECVQEVVEIGVLELDELEKINKNTAP